MTFHAVWAAVTKLNKEFDKEYPGNDYQKIRTHTGRTTAITTLMGEGLPLPITMKFARHKPASITTHLAYGQLTVQDVYNHLSGWRKVTNSVVLNQLRSAKTD
eukprot:1822894-Amphidinium_carterae.1